MVCQLVHLSNQAIDVILPVSMVTTFNKVCSLLSVSTTSVAQFEWPQEVVGFLEMLSHREDLVNEVLHADDTVLTKLFFNNGIIGNGRTTLFNFAESSFVDQFTYTFQIRVPAMKLKSNKIY